MKKEKITLKKDRSGITLIELIVGCMLMGIVMVGVVAFSLSLQQMQEAQDKKTLLALRTEAVVKHFERTASRIIGDFDDPGVAYEGAGYTISSWVSLRTDEDETPGDYTDDLWTVYKVWGVDDQFLGVCKQYADPDPSTGTCGNLPPINYQILTNNLVRGESFLAFGPTTIYPSLYLNHVWLKIVTRWNPKLPSNDITNPSYRLEIRIYSPSHSF